MKFKKVGYGENNGNYNFYKANDITPKDDAFHGNIKLLDIEWWYFDAVFFNGYSIHIGFRIYHIRNFGIGQSRINIYKNVGFQFQYNYENNNTNLPLYDYSLNSISFGIYWSN